MDIHHLPTQLENRGQVYCVTGGGGYVGSWLVKTLLENGYTVHATLRDPSKNTFLRSLPGAQERLHLFTADLSEEGSFDSAINGCHGVFHVATPMMFGESKDPEKEIIQAAVQGTLNVLQSCKKAESVRRVVFTSSYVTALPLGKSLVVIDESCWTSLDVIRETSSQMRFYTESKTLAEKAALQFGMENPPLAVVSILLPSVAGPSITSAVPLSINMMFSLIGPFLIIYVLFDFKKLVPDNPRLLPSFVGNSIPLIHVEDACNAHLFLMKHPAANGRYLCSGHTTTIPEIAHLISERCPQYTIKAKFDDSFAARDGWPFSSKKLLDLGFNYKYSLEEVIDNTVEYSKNMGILE